MIVLNPTSPNHSLQRIACHASCLHRRLATHYAGAAPYSAVTELVLVSRYPSPTMNIQQTEAIVAQHAQKYRSSCSPSLAEMLLKLRGAVPIDYSAEQDRDQDTNIGLANIKDKTIAGQTFRHLQDTTSAKPFSERINDLLAADQPVGIYLPTPFGFHGFVIAGRDQGHYVLLSKFSEEGQGQGRITLKAILPENDINAFAHRDTIFLE